jgi:hypothetical protein
MSRCERNVRILPFAPCLRGSIANGLIGIGKHDRVGIDQRDAAQLLRDGLGKAFPFPWKDAPNILGYPLYLCMVSLR